MDRPAAHSPGSRRIAALRPRRGRPSGDLGHQLSVQEDVGLLREERDTLRPARVLYRIEEPLITFYYGVMRPAE